MSDLALRSQTLPVGSFGRRASGWFGVWCVVATEGAIFVYLLFTYFYLASQSESAWPPGGAPSLLLAGPNTVILLLSSASLVWAERSGARRAAGGRLLGGLAVAFILGCMFAGIQLAEWASKPFSLKSGTYGAIYFTVTGFHFAHVVAGLLMIALLLVWAVLGYFSKDRHAPLTIGAIYWHFVDAVWLVVFATLYLLPYIR